MARKAQPPRLYVLAGINGAGKSSIGGAMIRASGADYFNPDEAARDLIAANPWSARTSRLRPRSAEAPCRD
jgi:predicted ABC-type ATPase